MTDDNDLHQRIRERAHKLWQEEGSPEGRAEAHWEQAREMIAIEDGLAGTLKPIDPPPPEEASLQQNLGEFPTLTDQGEEQTTPRPLSH